MENRKIEQCCHGLVHIDESSTKGALAGEQDDGGAS